MFKLFLITILIPISAAFAVDGRQVIVGSYFGYDNFKNRLNERPYLESGGKYYSSDHSYYYVFNSGEDESCSNILHTQENPALDRMLEIDYIDEAFKVATMVESGKLNPYQLRTFELAEPDPLNKSPTAHGRNLVGAQHFYPAKRKAGVMTVAGQFMDLKTGNIKREKVTWQLDPDFKKWADENDPNENKWDLRRAFQTEPGLIDELLPFVSASIHGELKAMHRSADNAFVYILSLNESHSRTYRFRFRDFVFAEANGKTIFKVPAKNFFALYPPEKVSRDIENIAAATNQKVKGLDAIDLIQDLRKRLYRELDLGIPRGKFQTTPLVFEDLGPGPNAFLYKTLTEKYHLTTDEWNKFVDEVSKILVKRTNDMPVDVGQHFDRILSSLIRKIPDAPTAVYISNIPAQPAVDHPLYIPTILHLVLHRLNEAYAPLLPGIDPAVAGMSYMYQHGIKIALATDNLALHLILEKYQAGVVKKGKADVSLHGQKYMFVHYFSLEDIERIQKTEKFKLGPIHSNFLVEDFWERFLLFSDLEVL